jgi:hypothetical protein
VSLSANVSDKNRWAKVKQSPREASTLPGPKGGGRGGDVAACAAQTNMHCWVHQDALLNEEQTETNMREAWEHEGSKDELNIVLHGLEKHFWKGTEAGRLGCYDFPGETWAGMDRQTKALCEQGASVFNDLGVIL